MQAIDVYLQRSKTFNRLRKQKLKGKPLVRSHSKVTEKKVKKDRDINDLKDLLGYTIDQ